MSVNTHNHCAPRAAIRRHARGVSIVEALVALVVLSVGMLGIASLYLESVRSNRTALQRTTAVFLINDLADRIRANRTAKTAYAMTLGTPPAAATTQCDSTSNCTPAQIAAFDLDRWHAAVIDRLPQSPAGANAQASVVYTAGVGGNPDSYVITTQWLEPGSTTPLSASLEVLLLGTS